MYLYDLVHIDALLSLYKKYIWYIICFLVLASD